MGQVIYTGYVNGNNNLNANGTDSVTVSLSQSGSFPSSYTVTSATQYLGKFYCYSTSKGIDLYLNGSKVNDGEMCGYEVTEVVNGMTSSWYSISDTWDLNTDANYEGITTAKIVSRSHSASSTGVMNLRDNCTVKITVNYSEGSSSGGGGDSGDEEQETTGWTLPSNVTVSPTTVNAYDYVTVSWTAGDYVDPNGVHSGVRAYDVYESSSADGVYSHSHSASNSLSVEFVPSSEPGTTLYFKVRARNYYGDSVLSDSYAVVHINDVDANSPPTQVNISLDEAVAGETATLSWSGASIGSNNIITSYDIYRQSSAEDSYKYLKNVDTENDATSGSTTVTAPTEKGITYYYRVVTLSRYGSAYASDMSASYASLTAAYAKPTPPTTITINGAADAYLAPGEEAVLEWSGETTDESVNPIQGYRVYKNNSTLLNTTEGSATVVASEIVGEENQYSVQVKCSRVNSVKSATVSIFTYGDPSAPTSIKLSDSTPYPNSQVTLSWSGAAAGPYNDIAGYEIYRAESESGEYTLLASITSTVTSASCVVVSPSLIGSSYYYKIKTVGERSTGSLSAAEATLTAEGDEVCTAPTSVSISAGEKGPGQEATISWSGAAGGGNNTIAGYEIYRSTSADGQYELIQTISTTEKNGLATVYAPEENGAVYYYKIATVGKVDGLNSEVSTSYVALTCKYADPTAPSITRINGLNSNYALAGSDVTLTWGSGEAGENNEVVSYSIYQDGEIYLEGVTTTSATVVANSVAGEDHSYQVVTVGQFSESKPSISATVLSYSHPEPPTKVSISNTKPSVGMKVTLTWSGAQPGVYNTIAGYEIYRSTEESAGYEVVDQVDATETDGSCQIVVPVSEGETYYYRVATIGTRSTGELSDVFASMTPGSSEFQDTFTDPVLYSGGTYVKAIHINEIQDAVNQLREYLNLETISFESIIAGETKIAEWSSHIEKIRQAIDEMGREHETWIEIPVNCPRADVIQQLRNVTSLIYETLAILGVCKLDYVML